MNKLHFESGGKKGKQGSSTPRPTPTDFRPNRIPCLFDTPYMNTLGRSEWESIASCIIAVSQEKGRWSPVKQEQFIPCLAKAVPEMLENGMLVHEGNGVMLSDWALARLKASERKDSGMQTGSRP